MAVGEFDRNRILAAAGKALTGPVLSLANAPAPRGLSEKNEFYSEKPAVSPDNGETEPQAAMPFLAHVDLLVACTARVAACTAAWRLTQEQRFFDAAVQQLRAWCLDEATRMVPNLEHAGTVPTAKGDDLRNNGVTQTICLTEFIRAASFLCAAPASPDGFANGMRAWCSELLHWFTDSARGTIARDTTNEQAVCWAMQAAELARFTRNDAVLRTCNHLFRDKLLRQMSFDGNFAYALHSRRPYAASIFALECLGTACEVLSTPFDNAWTYTLPDGRGMRAATAWLLPFVKSRGKWPYVSDAHLFGEEPLRVNSLLFAGRALNRQDYVDTWKAMRPDPPNAELAREYPVTQPALFATRPPA